jgi:hypothetical protein
MVTNLDSYALRARLFPCLIVILPVSLVVIAFQPAESWAFNLLAGAVTSFGLTFLLSQLGRDLGKKLEPKLFQKFGGVPTTLLFSHRHTKLDIESLNRYHRILEKFIPDLKMPTPQDEEELPETAYQKYETCTRFLREKTRDRMKFRLVFAENVNYGFRRNLLGMKPAGAVISLIGIIACGLILFYKTSVNVDRLILPSICLLINIYLFVWWILRIKVTWVETVAWEYANQLLSACDSLEETKATGDQLR